MKAKIKAANARTVANNYPTRGMKAKTLMMGLKSRKWPNTFMTQATHLKAVVWLEFADLICSKITDEFVSSPYLQWSMASKKAVLKNFSVTQQQRHCTGHELAVKSSRLFSPRRSFGFQGLKVARP